MPVKREEDEQKEGATFSGSWPGKITSFNAVGPSHFMNQRFSTCGLEPQKLIKRSFSKRVNVKSSVTSRRHIVSKCRGDATRETLKASAKRLRTSVTDPHPPPLFLSPPYFFSTETRTSLRFPRPPFNSDLSCLLPHFSVHLLPPGPKLRLKRIS